MLELLVRVVKYSFYSSLSVEMSIEGHRYADANLSSIAAMQTDSRFGYYFSVMNGLQLYCLSLLMAYDF